MRAEPLKEIVLESLRLVSDRAWFDGQVRLAGEGHNGGRRSKDGDRQSRPKLLNGLLVCPEHNRPLYVSGPHGRQMHCPSCRRLPAEQRALFSALPRALAGQLILSRIAELIRGNERLVDDVAAACQLEVEAAERPDPAALTRLRTEIERTDRAIELTRRTVGETPEDQAKAEQFIKQLQQERGGLVVQIRALEIAAARTPRMPTKKDVAQLVHELAEVFLAAAQGEDRTDVTDVRAIVELLTDGRIELYQMGERKAKRGWLQARFTVRILSYLVEKLTQAPATTVSDGIEVVIDLKRPASFEQEADRAWDLYKAGRLHKEIAIVLKCSRSKVTSLVNFAAQERGEDLEDGRARRARLTKKQLAPSLYEQIVDDVMRRFDAGELLQDIAVANSVGRDTITAVIRRYHDVNNLLVPDGRSRRKSLKAKVSKRSQKPDASADSGQQAA
jgi:hypothetical protein